MEGATVRNVGYISMYRAVCFAMCGRRRVTRLRKRVQMRLIDADSGRISRFRGCDV